MVACGSADKTTFKLNGAGATFPAPLYTAWFTDNRERHKVNYQAVAGGAGVRQYAAKTVDFGASDGAVKDEKIPAGGMIQIPVTGGAIVPAYNNPGCVVKMTQTQLADVFLGKITNWSEFGCADKTITTVWRSGRFWNYQRVYQLLLLSLLSGGKRWALVRQLCGLLV